MSRLEQYVVTAVLVAILILIALIVFAANAQQAPAVCMDSEERETLRKLSLDAIDQAYKDQIKHLFQTWVVDSAEQPKRARVGAQNAISAHVRARADALKWNPPLC